MIHPAQTTVQASSTNSLHSRTSHRFFPPSGYGGAIGVSVLSPNGYDPSLVHPHGNENDYTIIHLLHLLRIPVGDFRRKGQNNRPCLCNLLHGLREYISLIICIRDGT